MSDKMKKTKMLKKNYEFKSVLNRGKYYGAEQVQAFIIENHLPFNMLGIGISKKVRKSSN
jgi:ribonuclease P protein component